MDELIRVMTEIKDVLKSIDSKLDDIRGLGIYSIDDIYRKVDTLVVGESYNLGDVCCAIEEISTGIDESVKKICDKLEDVQSAVENVESSVEGLDI